MQGNGIETEEELKQLQQFTAQLVRMRGLGFKFLALKALTPTLK